MKTGEIISRGVQLYKQNWRQVLLLGLLAAGVGVVSGQLSTLGGETKGQLVSLLFDFLLCPIILFGMYRYYLGLWRGQSADLKGVLYYCRSGKVIAVCYGLIFVIVVGPFCLFCYCCFHSFL